MAGADANLTALAQESGADVGTLRRWQQQDGWRDLMGQVLVKTSGTDRPTFQAMSAIPGALERVRRLRNEWPPLSDMLESQRIADLAIHTE